MNQLKLVKAGINVLEGLTRFNNNTMLYEKFLYRFLEDGNYATFKTALAENNIPAAFEAAHALKGLTGNLSLDKMHEIIIPLVEELRAERMPDQETMLKPLEAAYQETLAAIKVDKEEAQQNQ